MARRRSSFSTRVGREQGVASATSGSERISFYNVLISFVHRKNFLLVPAQAVLAPSGLNQPAPQAQLGALVIPRALSAGQTLGEAIPKAKSQVDDVGVRESYLWWAIPPLCVQQPAR